MRYKHPARSTMHEHKATSLLEKPPLVQKWSDKAVHTQDDTGYSTSVPRIGHIGTFTHCDITAACQYRKRKCHRNHRSALTETFLTDIRHMRNHLFHFCFGDRFIMLIRVDIIADINNITVGKSNDTLFCGKEELVRKTIVFLVNFIQSLPCSLFYANFVR